MHFISVASIAGFRANATFPMGTGEFPATGDKKKVLPSGGNFMGVYARDKDQQKVAWELLKFANTTEGIAIWNDSGYMVASNDRLAPLPGQEPAYRQMEAGLTNETIWPGPRGLEALNLFNDWMSKIVRGTVPVEQGMKDGNAAVAALLP
jgi:multiple sugar transport system substrate-binding protein